MKKILFVLMGLLSSGYAMADDDFRCFVSVGMKNPIRLQFVFPPDGSDLGSVIYQSGHGAIQIRRKSEKTIKEVPNGRPWEFETVWVEITKDGSGGKYVMTTQGASVYEFKYIRKKDGKVFSFKVVPDFEGENGCKWDLPQQ